MAAKLELLKRKGRQKNNSSRDEIHKKNSRIHLTDYTTYTQIAKELKVTQILDRLLEYKRNWIQHLNRMPRNILPRVMKHYSPAGRRNHARPLKRLLGTWDVNGSTSGPSPWQIYADDILSAMQAVHSWDSLPTHTRDLHELPLIF